MLRIGVVGCGRWGRNIIRNFNELGVLSAVSDVLPYAAEECSAAYSVPTLSSSKMFSSENIDAVAIAVPAESHAELAMQAISRGKHVFVEKPIATNFVDAAQMIAAARDHRVTLMAGHLLRYHPAFTELLKIYSEGGIGKIQYIQSYRSGDQVHFRGEHAIWGFAPHDVSMILALLGELPSSVFAHSRARGSSDGPDAVVSMMEFPSGAAGHLVATWMHPCRVQRLIVSGDNGNLIFDDCLPWNSKLKFSQDNGQAAGDIASGRFTTIEISELEPLRLECEHFIECIDLGLQPKTNGREALAVVRVLDAMSDSIATGNVVVPDQILFDDESTNQHFEDFPDAFSTDSNVKSGFHPHDAE